MDNKLIVLAGATGNLGGRIARALLQRGAGLIALVRYGSAPGKVDELRTLVRRSPKSTSAASRR